MSDQAVSPVPVESIDTSATSEPSASPETQKPSSPKLKAIIDGVEQDVNQEDLIKDYQKYKSADKRFQEAAQLRKQAEEYISQWQPTLEALMTLDKDPWAVHKHLGMNYEDIATNYAYEKAMRQYEEENMSPQEKRIKQLEQKLSSYESETKKRQEQESKLSEERKKQEQEKYYAEAIQKIDSDILGAIQKSGVKPTPRLIARIADEISNHLEAKGELLSADIALRNVRNEVSNYSPEELIALLKDEHLEKISAYRASKQVGKPIVKPGVKPETYQDDLDRELSDFFKIKRK